MAGGPIEGGVLWREKKSGFREEGGKKNTLPGNQSPHQTFLKLDGGNQSIKVAKSLWLIYEKYTVHT